MSAQEIRSFPVCMDLVDSLEEPKVLDQAKTSYRHRERNRERDHVSRFQTLETRPSLGSLEYRPLRPDKRDIRLLILEPTVSHTINIDASMETISLDAKPTYEALSYTWGPSKRPSGKIYVDGYELDVADTLFDALDSLRRNQNGEQRRIWADAICINQKDPQEKSWQIQLMASIYKCASRTLIWVELSGAVNLTAVSQLTARKFLADMEQIEKDADSDD
ncbi:heterokaryon incompatibility [Colletotrichum kahawae]|uniref:Heterokaryon incompatibility n=1 Tax=Colletotrichum kahawae TaxID=34407 RepID=A0AAE0CXI4_COLKA|nr:heterokaryon incompatibility [Colletotrichum kahawae]